MCAINPKQKKRIIFDFYTSSSMITKEDFDKMVIEHCLNAERKINATGKLRCHIKESIEDAE